MVFEEMFSWEERDDSGEAGTCVYYNCRLNRKIGKFNRGKKIDSIYVNYPEGKFLFRNLIQDEGKEQYVPFYVGKLKMDIDENF